MDRCARAHHAPTNEAMPGPEMRGGRVHPLVPGYDPQREQAVVFYASLRKSNQSAPPPRSRRGHGRLRLAPIEPAGPEKPSTKATATSRPALLRISQSPGEAEGAQGYGLLRRGCAAGAYRLHHPSWA